MRNELISGFPFFTPPGNLCSKATWKFWNIMELFLDLDRVKTVLILEQRNRMSCLQALGPCTLVASDGQAFCFHNVFTASSLLFHCNFTASSLLLHCFFTPSSLRLHCFFTLFSLLLHASFTSNSSYSTCSHIRPSEEEKTPDYGASQH